MVKVVLLIRVPPLAWADSQPELLYFAWNVTETTVTWTVTVYLRKALNGWLPAAWCHWLQLGQQISESSTSTFNLGFKLYFSG